MSGQRKEGDEAPVTGTASGQSLARTGSGGSPSCRSEPVTEDGAFSRIHRLDIQGDVAASVGVADSKKKRIGQRATGADKGERGLRQFSMKVLEKVESKGRTTYNEVADELVSENAQLDNSSTSPGQPQCDNKNIRRRVYDALNVLLAMDIISRDNKEIQWKGLPHTTQNDIEELKRTCQRIRNSIEKKGAYLQDLEKQFIGSLNLIRRNKQLCTADNRPSRDIALPFVLVQTLPNARVEVEMSEDRQLVHFDFDSTPFVLRDDTYVLKALNLCVIPYPSPESSREELGMSSDVSDKQVTGPSELLDHPM